jgi:hypothetical protein
MKNNLKVKSMTKKILGVLSAVFLFASAMPCYASGPAVSDTGYSIGQTVGNRSMHWVDNSRLLFSGNKTGELGPRLYLWDDAVKSVRLYSNAQGACFSKDAVRYQTRVNTAAGTYVVKEGPFGSEKEIEKPLPSKEELSTQGQMARVHSEFTCKVHLRDELVPPASRDHAVVVLREGDGYIDLGPSGGKDYYKERKAFPRNLMLYQARTGKAIPLPMTWEEDIASYDISYSAYRDAYVLRPKKHRGAPVDLNTSWPKNQSLITYLLFSNGRTESVSIPYWPSEYLVNPTPVKSGWIFGGGNFYKRAGLYLYDGKAVSKLDTGLVDEIAVSPDGCKAAVAIQNKHLDMGTPTNLRIFDFCK